MKKPYDFGGWATKNDLKCSDGRVIRAGAFSVQDGATVPLVWNHQHNTVSEVLGHAVLENRNEGVYAYGYFNGTQGGRDAKECVEHGDVVSMSIWANDLQQNGPDVLHGTIREVSLVLAGANPGAFIESVLSHGMPMEDYEEEGLFYTGEGLILSHAIEEKPKEEPAEKKEETPSEKKPEEKSDKEETIQDVIDSMTEKQKNVLYAMVADVAGSDDTDDDSDNKEEKEEKKEDAEMKHNVFSDGQGQQSNTEFLSHADEEKIFADARRIGSLREAVRQNIEGGVLVHASIPNVPTNGMTEPTAETESYKDYGKYGFKNPSMFYPDHRSMNTVPEFISRRMDWVSTVMGGVHHTPFSRVKSMYANITEDEARARGYFKKGEAKKYEVFKTLKRVINPTTIYKLQKLDRDDITDITDFDVVAWIRGEMRTMLEEEIARAILIGDGRQDGTEDKISEECIRPIAKDVDLFNVKVPITFEAETDKTGADKAKKVIDAVIRAHKNYRGSGNPTMFTTEDWLTEMLLLEDKIGHKLYKTTQELATALRVSNIVTVEAMEADEYQKKFGESSNEQLIAVIVNLADYNVGMDRGGEVNMFDDFDIDFNQFKYLIETRMSGGLVKPFSALTVTGKQGE